MADHNRLIPDSLLSLSSFRRELLAFFGLSLDQLHQLNSISDSASGLSPSRQTLRFGEQTSLSLDEARQSLSIAEYTYERCRDNQISPDDAAAQLVEIAGKLGIEDAPSKQAAWRDLLSIKATYESDRRAIHLGVSIAPHFAGLDGVWDIRPVFNRETGEIVGRVPVLLISVSWHDMAGTHHNAAFQLNDEEWVEMRRKLDSLQQNRKTLQRDLDKQ